jgi:molecular chaperone HtpG
VLKEGAAFDFENKDRIVPLLRFRSSTQGETLASLPDYVSRMKPEQKDIYYMTGESIETLIRSPHLEALKARDLEVLLMTDPIDELVVQALDKFEDRALKSAGKGTVPLGTEEEQNQTRKNLNAKQVEYLDLMTLLKAKLAKHVKEVRLTNRLTRSPACLVVSEEDMSPQLARLFRAQHGTAPETLRGVTRILELNPEHDIVQKLRERAKADANDPILEDYAELLYGGALIAEGSELEDPSRFTEALTRLMTGNV